MNIKQLETFYWAAKLGSFTAAAERLHATQSTVSMRIHDLEEDLGVELFDRSQRTARVTPRGRELFGYAERMLNLAAEIRDRISSPDAIPGSIRMGVAEMISVTWLPSLVRTLHERHPKVVLELDEALTADLVDRLRTGHLDLILAPGRVPGYDMVRRGLGSVQLHWMASPSVPLPEGRLGPEDLQGWPVIALSPTSAHHARVEDWFRSSGAFCTRLYTCKSFGVCASLAAAGLGVTLLPLEPYREMLDAGRLRIIETDRPMAPMDFNATVAPGATQAVTELVADLAAELSTFDRSER